jgi:hypothetical protein
MHPLRAVPLENCCLVTSDSIKLLDILLPGNIVLTALDWLADVDHE